MVHPLSEDTIVVAVAIELDSYYAAPRYWLAGVYRAQGKLAAAIEQYRLFLDHAAQGDADRASAVRALVDLGASPRDSSP